MSQALQLTGLGVHYQGAEQALFEGLDLSLPEPGWSCLLGRSGCGKTSLLRLLAGLVEPQHQRTGEVSWQGKSWSLAAGDALPVAYMAQQDLLFPWLTVLDNVCLASRLNNGKVSDSERARAKLLLEQLGLENSAKQLPEQLSGGMRQRVALARTLMQDTPLVLMDEPFSALDAVTRHRLQELAVSALAGRCVLLITHDPQEALRLGDQVWLFEQQALTPVAIPDGDIPRPIDSQLADYQRQLLEALQRADKLGGQRHVE